MKIIQETIPDRLREAVLPLLKVENSVLFDIETTGLSHRSSHLYLIGAVSCRSRQWTLRQWFMEKPTEEAALLQQFSAFLQEENASALIHYNGDTFDLPYLHSKYTFYGMPDPLAVMQSQDLYRQLRPYRQILGLSAMKQKDIEKYAGILREDAMTGGELIQVYRRYLRTASPEDLSLLLLHNRDDLAGLAGILPVTAICRLFEGEFRARQADMPDSAPARVQEPALKAARETGQDAEMIFSILPAVPLPAPLHTASAYCRVDAGNGTDDIRLTVPLLQGTLLHFFRDYKNYYYLPAEDQAIHKSVAQYVEKEYRVRATAATCYQKVCGTFLPHPFPGTAPVFRRTFKDTEAWIRLEKGTFPDAGQLHAYVLGMLQTLL